MVAQVPVPTKPYPNTAEMSRDEFEEAINRWVSEVGPVAEGMNDVAIEVNEAVATVDAAVEALASAKWITGTTYAIGDVRYSTLDFFNYRRKTAGAGSTDPSLDPTNWALLTKTANGGSDTTSSAIDISLSSTAGRLQIITMTAANKKVTLPAATALVKGSSIFVIRNAGNYRFAIRNNAAAFLCWLNPGQIISFGCSDISTAAGVWTLSGEKIERIYDGETAQSLNSVASTMINVAMLSATKAIAVYKNGTDNLGYAVIANYGSAAGTPVLISGVIEIDSIAVSMLTTTTAIAVYQNSSGAVSGHVLTISGDTISVGAVQSINATTGSYDCVSLATLSATKVLIGYHYTTGTFRERHLAISGNTITASAEVVAETSSTTTAFLGLDIVKPISSSKALTVTQQGSVWRLQDTSGTLPAPTGTALSVTVYGTVSPLVPGVCVLSTTRALMIRHKQAYLIDISGLTPVLLMIKSLPVDLVADGSHMHATKLDSTRAYVTWTGNYSGGMDARIITITSDDRILFSEVQEKIEPLINASVAQYIAVDMLDSTHVIQVYRNASNFLSAKVIEVN